jgi:hypothetical protein
MVDSQIFTLYWKHTPYNSCTNFIWISYIIFVSLDWRLGFEPTLQLIHMKRWNLRALQNEIHMRTSILITALLHLTSPHLTSQRLLRWCWARHSHTCSGAAAAAALGVSTCVKSKVELRKTVKLSWFSQKGWLGICVVLFRRWRWGNDEGCKLFCSLSPCK